jgi:hypothetical protein
MRSDKGTNQSSWSKGISEMKYKQQNPCSNCMLRPVMSQANACTSQAYACMYCMHCPLTSQADACSYCMCSIVLILSRIYLYLQLLWVPIGTKNLGMEKSKNMFGGIPIFSCRQEVARRYEDWNEVEL